jgi:hypothetical protein
VERGERQLSIGARNAPCSAQMRHAVRFGALKPIVMVPEAI